MFTTITADPITLVSVSAFKAYAKIDTSDDDSIISQLSLAAQKLVENKVNKALGVQTRTTTFDLSEICPLMKMPRCLSITTIDSITSYDSDNVASVVDVADYTLLTSRVRFSTMPNDFRQEDSMVFEYTLGSNTLSDNLLLSIKMICLNWYENRESLQELNLQEMPLSVEALLKQEINYVF